MRRRNRLNNRNNKSFKEGCHGPRLRGHEAVKGLMPGRNNTAYHSTLHHRGKQEGDYWRCTKKQAPLPDFDSGNQLSNQPMNECCCFGHWELGNLSFGQNVADIARQNINTMNINNLSTSRLARSRTRQDRLVRFRTARYSFARFGTSFHSWVRFDAFCHGYVHSQHRQIEYKTENKPTCSQLFLFELLWAGSDCLFQ